MDCAVRCGWWSTAGRIVMAVADGLGQGEAAAHAAELALASIGAAIERPFGELFAACEARLRDTGGVALAVAVVELDGRCLSMATVGNVRALLWSANAAYRLDQTQGVIGGGFACLSVATRTLLPGDVLALFSAGIDESPALRESLERSSPASSNQVLQLLDRCARRDRDAALLIYRHPC
jgi:hypothetical protein